MKESNIEVETAKKCIVEILAKKPLTRKELVKKCIEHYKKKSFLNENDLKDKKPSSPLNIAKSRTGNAIDWLLRNQIVVQNEDKMLNLKSDGSKDIDTKEINQNIQRDSVIEKYLLEIIAAEPQPLTKQELFKKLLEKSRDEIGKDDSIIKSDAGRILSGLKKSGRIEEKDELFSLAKPPETDSERNRRLLDEITDESLVNCSVEMLVQLYTQIGYKDVAGENIDGPNDGGIDGIIQMTDMFGIKEKVILQVKNYHSSKKGVPEHEMREFCGVLAAEKDAAKGLFITSKKFTSSSKTFASKFKTKYLALIDGSLWLELAEQCDYKLSE